MKRIVIFGERYSDNLGDGVICQCMEHLVSSCAGEGTSVTVRDLSCRESYDREFQPAQNLWHKLRCKLLLAVRGNPVFQRILQKKYTQEECRYINYNMIGTKHKVLSWCKENPADVVIFAGGELFKDYFLPYITYLTEGYGKQGAKIYFNACGVDSQNLEYVNRRFSKVLKNKAICALTTRSLPQTCEKLIDKQHYCFVPDPAICAKQVYQVGKNTDNPCIGLGVMAIDDLAEKKQKLLAFWSELVAELDNQGIPYRLFCNGEKADYAFAKEVALETGCGEDKLLPCPEAPEELVKQISGFTGVCAFRMHASIIAYALEIPFVSFAWDQKLYDFAASVKQSSQMVDWELVSAKEVLNKLKQYIHNVENHDALVTAIHAQVDAIVGGNRIQPQPCKVRILEGEKIKETFIHNMCHEQKRGYTVIAEYGGVDYATTFTVEGGCADLHLWLKDIPVEVIECMAKEIFLQFSGIQKMYFTYSLHSAEKKCSRAKGNHWKLLLPESRDALLERISSKQRYNLKREKRIVQETFQDMQFAHYSCDDVPIAVVEEYFRFKAITHGADYHMQAKEYLDKYRISDVYCLYLRGAVGSVLFSCEQGESVYLENLSYNPEFSKFSLGKILYEYFLDQLIAKNKKVLYLGGGQQEYKHYFGAVEDVTYDGVIYRSNIAFFREVWFPKAVKCVIQKVRFAGHKIKKAINLRARLQRFAAWVMFLFRWLWTLFCDPVDLQSCKGQKEFLICAHPDDESLFFYNTLQKNKDLFVICLSNRYDPVRRAEFAGAMEAYGVKGIICHGPDYPGMDWAMKRYILSILKKVRKLASPDRIFTHNRDGEYGHIHHKTVHSAVVRIFKNSKIYVPCFGEPDRNKWDEQKAGFCKAYYPSQDICNWFEDYFRQDEQMNRIDDTCREGTD